MTDARLVTCPHCRSEIPHGANICKGCRAEIKYGTPAFFIVIGLIVPAVAGYFIAKFLFKSMGIPENVATIIWVAVTFIGWFYAVKINRRLFSDHISFVREKLK